MGRQLRRVPPNWQHPTMKDTYTGDTVPRPMYDQTFAKAALEWHAGYATWQAGDRPPWAGRESEYWEHHSPPEREDYRPWPDGDAKWYQVWETVSYGTPVTPPFATASELIEYLVANGDLWDQRRRRNGSTMPCGPWPREAAERMVLGGVSAPTLIVAGSGVNRGISMGG